MQSIANMLLKNMAQLHMINQLKYLNQNRAILLSSPGKNNNKSMFKIPNYFVDNHFSSHPGTRLGKSIIA